MMRGLQSREEGIPERARRSFAKIAAGLVLVSTIGCSSTPLMPTPNGSSYYSTPVRPQRELYHHLDERNAPVVTIREVEVKALDLVLPMESLMRRSRTQIWVERDGALTQSDTWVRDAQHLFFLQTIPVERYDRRDAGTLRVGGEAKFAFAPQIYSGGQVVQEPSMIIAHRIGGPVFERSFPAADFVYLAEATNNGRPFDGITLIDQGAYGRYTCFAVPTVRGQPVGRVPQGQIAMAVTFDYQRGEAVGGVVVLRDP